MNEEEKQVIKELKHFTNMTVFWKEKEYTSSKIDNCINIVLHLIDKQQKQIEILKNNLLEERAFCKSTLETLKNCVDKDYLHKMISFKDGEIEKLKEAYQTLKDDIEGHRIAYVDTPEFEENYISKDKIKAKAQELDNQQRQWREDRTNKHTDAEIIYARDVLEKLLGE